MTKKTKKTNITQEMIDAFTAVTSNKYNNLALYSCFLDGDPTSAVVAVEKSGDEFLIRAIFVYCTDEILQRITNHDGLRPEDLGPVTGEA
jgi:hypothetical protein